MLQNGLDEVNEDARANRGDSPLRAAFVRRHDSSTCGRGGLCYHGGNWRKNYVAPPAGGLISFRPDFGHARPADAR